MEKYVVEEIVKNLKWYEKILIKVFTKTAVKVYNCARLNTINAIKR